MAPFKKRSLKWKLTLLMVSTSGIALLVATVAFVAANVTQMRRSKVRQLEALTYLLASNSEAALSFDMPQSATDLLASLEHRPTIESACLFNKDAKLFATYQRNPQADFSPTLPDWEGHRFLPDGYLGVAHTVREENRPIGTIYVRASMSDVSQQVYWYVLIAVGVTSLSLAVAIVFALGLQRVISNPIASLATTAEQITEGGDYSIRVIPRSTDEIGNLYRQFNLMLQQIQTREEELSRLTAIIEATSDLVGMALPNGNVTYLNRAGRQLTGIGKDAELAGMDVSDMHPDWALRIIQSEGIPTAIKTASWQGETAIQRADGREVPVSQVITSHKSPRGDVEYLSTIIRDISDRKLAEKERERLIAGLETQNAELERFTYTVSHDLKTPLITFKGYMGALQRDIARNDTEAMADDISRMSGAADRMAELLDDLLDLSRIGRQTNPPEDIVIEDLAREAVNLICARLEAKGVQVVISSGCTTVFGDRIRLLEVMQNLVDNAVKYMGDQPEPRIEIGASQEGDETTCFVRDNGIGIDPRYHENIFGLFNQLDPKVAGSGVGLTLVKRIVEVHGGRISVESDGAGRGSTFYFILSSTSESAKPPGL